ncbi:MAG: AAA family ATPase [Pirellulales bacterium]
MATAEQLKALIQSYTAGDRNRFMSVAMQISAHAARTGKEKLAADLQKLIDEARNRQPEADAIQPVPIARPGGDLAGLVAATYPHQRLSDMVLDQQARERLERVLTEYRQREKLLSHGFHPRRKLLLVGPPGCGKTMTASVLAGELGLPLLYVQLHTLITKFMGETAAKLHMIFDAMHQTRGVYLFDEFDAIGAHRGAENDVGEIRRVLNSFLQFLERDDSDSMTIAATNFYGMLDHALFRRFDDVVRYSWPNEQMIRQLIRNRLSAFDIRGLKWTPVVASAAGLSHADIVHACEDAAKDAILQDSQRITAGMLTRALANREGRADPNQVDREA